MILGKPFLTKMFHFMKKDNGLACNHYCKAVKADDSNVGNCLFGKQFGTVLQILGCFYSHASLHSIEQERVKPVLNAASI